MARRNSERKLALTLGNVGSFCASQFGVLRSTKGCVRLQTALLDCTLCCLALIFFLLVLPDLPFLMTTGCLEGAESRRHASQAHGRRCLWLVFS